MQETRTEGKRGPRESRGVTQREDVLKITEPTTGRNTRSFGDSLLPAPGKQEVLAASNPGPASALRPPGAFSAGLARGQRSVVANQRSRNAHAPSKGRASR